MSYYETLEVISMNAGEALGKYDMVHINGGTRRLLKVTDVDAEGICGVVQESVEAYASATLAIGGVSKVVAGDTITAGDRIGSDVNAKAVTLAGGSRMMGIALADAVVGDVIPAIIYIGDKKAVAEA